MYCKLLLLLCQFLSTQQTIHRNLEVKPVTHCWPCSFANVQTPTSWKRVHLVHKIKPTTQMASETAKFWMSLMTALAPERASHFDTSWISWRTVRSIGTVRPITNYQVWSRSESHAAESRSSFFRGHHRQNWPNKNGIGHPNATPNWSPRTGSQELSERDTAELHWPSGWRTSQRVPRSFKSHRPLIKQNK